MEEENIKSKKNDKMTKKKWKIMITRESGGKEN